MVDYRGSETPPISRKDDIAGEEIRLLLVGSEGAGKSATGNTILMWQCFKESDDPVRKEMIPPSARTTQSTGNEIVVIDTPDLAKYEFQIDEMKRMHLMGLASPGPHAILLVISTKMRISREIQDTIEIIREVFGETSANYMIVVFTHIDQLRIRAKSKELTSIHEYVKQLEERNPMMRKLLQDCQHRYIGFDNNLPFKSKAQEQTVVALMEMVDKMIKQNNQTYFTNPTFKLLEAEMKKLEEKIGKCRKGTREVLGEVLGIDRSSYEIANPRACVSAGRIAVGAVTSLEGGQPLLACIFVLAGILLMYEGYKKWCCSDIDNFKTNIEQYKKQDPLP